MGIQEVSVFRGIHEVSARRLRKELINHNLFLFARPFKADYGWPFVNDAKIQEIHIFKLNKIYLHSRHYFTSSSFIFMQLQGIVFIRLQGNDILVNCEGNTDSFKERIFIHKKYNHSRQIYSDTKLYSFQGTLYLFGQGNISSFSENILIQGSYIHSRK